MTAADADVVVVGAARTPQGRFCGSLGTVPATELGAAAIRGALNRAAIDASVIDAVVMGQVLQAGAGQNPARQAALLAGVGERAHATTVNKVCLSGLSAVIDAARLIRVGEASVVVAGGMESMSLAPHLLRGARSGLPYGAVPLVDHVAHDGLTDARDQIAMGELTERRWGQAASRARQDAFAVESHQRAAQAQDAGLLEAEIVPVTVRGRRGEVVVDTDEGVRRDSSVDSLGRLRPAFAPGGNITAGNASGLSDGAAALVLTTRGRASRAGWRVLATVRAHAQVAGDNTLNLKPSDALLAALEKQGWTIDDLTVIEINEAFASVALSSAEALGLADDDPRLNPHGGALALGHPLGASGARLVVHASHVIARSGGRAGLALCGGGGQGDALLLEAP